jgi:hypothetical protein
MTKIAAAFLAAIICASASSALAAEVRCAEHKRLVGMLSKKYKENPVAVGTVNDDRFMQVFVSRRGTWTVLVTKTNGESCILAAGQNWEKLPTIVEADPAA